MISRISSQRAVTISRRCFNSSSKICSKDTPKVPPKQPAPTSSNAAQKDPHQLASDMVKNSPDTRISGTEALSSLTPEQKMRNYVTALGLVGFCTGVWYYSIQSVGKADGGLDELRMEAQEAKDNLNKKNAEEINAEELAGLDATADEIAQKEEAELMIASEIGGVETTVKKRPLWKKVVFFWKKE